MRFYKLKIAEDPMFGKDLGIWQDGPGKWHGDSFYFRNPILIVDQSRDIAINAAKDNYNKLVRIFWISGLASIPVVLLLLSLVAE